MKKIMIPLLIFCNNLYSQNLISNPSFEFGSSSKPKGIGQLNFCDNWKSLTTDPPGDCGDPGGSSPDWFKSQDPFLRVNGITAHNGQAYAGTAKTGEIIQQKIPKLTPGRHRLKMFVRGVPLEQVCVRNLTEPYPPNGTCGNLNPCCGSGVSRTQHQSLNIFLSNSKIEYNDILNSNSKLNNLMPITKVDIPIESLDNWVEIKVQFMVFDENIEWIGIEGGSTGYSFIDDVDLQPIPVGECSQCGTAKAGTLNNITIKNINSGYPIEIKGLNNVTEFQLEVRNALNQTVESIRTLKLKNPHCNITFDHKDEAGNMLVVQSYYYKLKIANECEYKVRTFQSFNDILPYPSDYPNDMSNDKISSVDNCCQDILELKGGEKGTYITNQCLNLSQYIELTFLPRLTVKARKSIIINSSSQLSTLKKVDLIAPTIVFNSKTFTSPMKILEGSFIPRNDCPIPLPELRRNNIENNDVVKQSNSLMSKEQILLNEELDNAKNDNYNFSLYPNPNSGKFTLTVEGIEEQIIYDVGISDLQGKIIYKSVGNISTNKEIDLSQFPVGMYLVKVISKDKVYFQKCNKVY